MAARFPRPREHHCALPTAEGALGVGRQVHAEDWGADPFPLANKVERSGAGGRGQGRAVGSQGRTDVCCIRFQDNFLMPRARS